MIHNCRLDETIPKLILWSGLYVELEVPTIGHIFVRALPSLNLQTIAALKMNKKLGSLLSQLISMP